VYDDKLQKAPLVHIHVDFNSGSRLLTHFYAFLFFADLATDKHMKRLIRDGLHYQSNIFCKAAEIVKLLKEEGGGSYSSLHMRFNDFQFPQARLPAARVVEETKDVLKEGELLYISTDEKNMDIFKPFFARNPAVRFLKDFEGKVDLSSLRKDQFGMLEQVVASRGRAFVGVWWSTFTGYIMRMRGYHDLEKQSWYAMPEYRNEMQVSVILCASGICTNFAVRHLLASSSPRLAPSPSPRHRETPPIAYCLCFVLPLHPHCFNVPLTFLCSGTKSRRGLGGGGNGQHAGPRSTDD
jgi:hypothetical protein